jgi:MFS family permease
MKTQVARASRTTRVRYLVLGWLCLAACLAYLHRACLAVPATNIEKELGLDLKEMGWVMAAFFLGYTIFQLPAGWLGDRWGTRRALPIFTVLWSAATGLMALPGGFLALFGSRLAMGAAQAGIFPCAVNTISRWFPPWQRALPSGLLGSCMSVGGILASVLTAFLLGLLSWQAVFVLLALPGFVWAAGFRMWFRDRPAEHSWVSPAELAIIQAAGPGADGPTAGGPGPASPWRTLLTSPQMGLICAQQFFRAAGYIFYQTWFPTYLQKARGVSVEESGYLTSLPLLGVVAGALVGGAVSDWLLARTGSRRLARKGLALTGQLVCAFLLLTAFFIDDATLAVLVITLGSCCAAAAGGVAYTLTMDLGGRHIGTVFSTMNMAGNVGAFVLPIVVPWLAAVTGQRWDLVLLLFVGIYLAAALCWMFVNPEVSLFPGTPSVSSEVSDQG